MKRTEVPIGFVLRVKKSFLKKKPSDYYDYCHYAQREKTFFFSLIHVCWGIPPKFWLKVISTPITGMTNYIGVCFHRLQGLYIMYMNINHKFTAFKPMENFLMVKSEKSLWQILLPKDGFILCNNSQTLEKSRTNSQFIYI